MSNREASHPYIGFVVNELKEIFYLMDTGQSGTALANMMKLLHSVDPRARKKEDWENLDSDLYKAAQARRSVDDTDPLVLQTKLAAFDYEFHYSYLGLYSRLWLIMWENGYMYEKTFTGFFDPSGGRKSEG